MFPISVGAAKIGRVEEIVCPMPLAMLGAGPDIIDRHRDWLYPAFVHEDDSWDMVVQSWLLLVDGKVVVVDPCTGNGRSFPAFPLFDRLDTPFIDRFEATGIRPEEVDYVFCTHLHMDHCGWNVRLRNGRYVPTFPNARYVMVRREVERWDPTRPGHRPSLPNEGTFETSVRPILEAGLAHIVGDRHRMTESLSIEPAYGHTAGHSTLHLRSAGEEAWFTGDVFHHPLDLVEPEIDGSNCEDHEMAVATRRRLVAEFLAKDALILPAHFAPPHAGRLRRDGGRLVFEPLTAQTRTSEVSLCT